VAVAQNIKQILTFFSSAYLTFIVNSAAEYNAKTSFSVFKVQG